MQRSRLFFLCLASELVLGCFFLLVRLSRLRATRALLAREGLVARLPGSASVRLFDLYCFIAFASDSMSSPLVFQTSLVRPVDSLCSYRTPLDGGLPGLIPHIRPDAIRRLSAAGLQTSSEVSVAGRLSLVQVLT